MSKLSNQKISTYVFLSTLPWDSNLLHREHMLVKAISQQGQKVYFVEKKYLSQASIFGLKAKYREADNVNVVTVSVIPYLRGLFKFVYKLNDYLLTKQLRDVFREMGEGANIISSAPNWGPAIANTKRPQDLVAYDMSDDMRAFAKNKRWSERVEKYEKKMIDVADFVVVTSRELVTRVASKKKVYVIENGVDIESFEKCKPILKDNIGERVVGYIGGIYEWVDLGLIEKSAKSYPKVHFALVGPTDRKDEVDALSKLSNVRYYGEVAWQEIGDYFASLDVGLIPFVSEKKYPRLKTVNSNKVYQYAYFGYPIVSTSFEQTRRMRDLVDVCENDDEFVSKLGTALAEENLNKKERLTAFARSNSWTSKSEQIMNCFSKEKEEVNRDDA